MTNSSWRPEHAAVVGTGTMGSGFAQLLALAGVPCAVVDESPERATRAREQTIASAERFEAQRLMPAGAAAAIAERVSAATSLEDAVAGAAFVIEAVPEDPELKRDVLSRVERAAPQGAIVATNTSAIPIRQLASAFKRPERFLGTHWFNPPQWVPCVEVIPTDDTAPWVVERVRELLRALGKQPTSVGDAAGFVANRIQFAMFKEAASVVADGVATAEQVDEIVRSSFGFRLPFFGPFAIADMAGLDVYGGAYEALEADLGPRFSPPEALTALLAQGRLGTKAGGGFLDIPPEAVERMTRRRDASYVALAELRRGLEQE